MAIPDHPWTKATPEAAAVRIAMTVGESGEHKGSLLQVVSERSLDSDQPEISFLSQHGKINADLSVGVDVTGSLELRANEGLCSPGVKLHGAGFIVTRQEAEHLGLGKRQGLDTYIRPYRNGRDLAGVARGVLVIDLFPLKADQVRSSYPEVYQRIVELVKPHRDTNNMAFRRENWWWFGATHEMYRSFKLGLKRYICTPETSKHRWFVFLDGEILADNMLTNIGTDDALCLGVLSSRIHVIWALAAGGWLGVGNDPRYSKSRCFDPFPFPECSEELKAQIRAVSEELDAHRKARQAEHPKLTLTQMYNVFEKLNSGEALSESEEHIKEDGLVLILKELHERLDKLVFQAYGWSEDLRDEQILERLVALNQERADEEKQGKVRWLRPDYSALRLGCGEGAAESREG